MCPPPLQIRVPSSENPSTLVSSHVPSSHVPLPRSPPYPPSTLCENYRALASSHAPLPPSLDSNRDTDVKNSLLDSVGEARVG